MKNTFFRYFVRLVWPRLMQGFLSLCLLCFLSACGQASNSDSSGAVSAAGDSKMAVTTPPVLVYFSKCIPSRTQFAGIHFSGVRTKYAFSANDFIKTTAYYFDDCRHIAFYVRELGKTLIKGPSPYEAKAMDEDFSFKSTYINIFNDAVAAAFNLEKACGLTGWRVHTRRDVSHQESKIVCPGKASPRSSPEIVLIENENLYLGANSNHYSDMGRPIKVDRSLPFVKH